MAKSDVNEKFWRLRDSGYEGPINQDGNAVETGPVAEILADLREKGA